MQDSFYEKDLPNKLYFKVGEVSAIADVPASVLRFWETEFKGIKPLRSSSGQRMYQKRDVELILQIKHLLYKKKFTIQGARQFLESPMERKKKRDCPKITISEIRKELQEIRNLLG